MVSNNKQTRPWLWRLWHPHQGFWNRDLLGMIRKAIPISAVREIAIGTVIFVDTLLFWMRAIIRRVLQFGPMMLLAKPKRISETQILYFDMGLYKRAKELHWMANTFLPGACTDFRAYGFEAGGDFFESAKTRFEESDKVSIYHVAVCHQLPSNGKLKLYKDEAGSSIYRDHLGEYEEVAAVRFSDWVREKELDMRNSICLIRMNVEGAEFDVISDLVESGFSQFVDGYFGMWDDVGKIDIKRDQEFRSLLAKESIRTCSFNNRDLNAGWLRRKCVEYQLNTAVFLGLKRIRRNSKRAD